MHADQSSNGGLEVPSRTTWTVLTPTFAVSGVLLIVGLGGAWYVHRANREISASLDESLAAAQAAARLVLEIRNLRLKLDRFVDTSDVSQLHAGRSLLGSVEDELEQSRFREVLEGNPDKSRYDNMRAAVDDFRQRFQRLLAQPAGERQRAAARELMASLTEGLLVPAEELLNHRQQTARVTSRRNQTVAQRIGLGLLLLGVCGAVAGLLLGFGVARRVHRSLVEISVPVRDIAGRLNEVVGPIKVSSNTGLVHLDDSLRALADKTADVVRRLQESQKESARNEQLAAVGQLAAGLAHELRNPLMSMKLIVQTAAERPHEPFKPRDLVVMEDEITRLEKMLQTFLDFARPPKPEKQTVDICQVVAQALEVVLPRAAQQDAQFHYSAINSPLWIEADESQMRQVLLNLLLNALDVMPNGGNVWTEVRRDELPTARPPVHQHTNNMLGATDQDLPAGISSHAVIVVSDDGPGLSADVADRIFDPFVSTKDTGIGLGLSICRRIVESHNGRITARNRKEGGAEFTIRLPLLQHEPLQRASVGNGQMNSRSAHG